MAARRVVAFSNDFRGRTCPTSQSIPVDIVGERLDRSNGNAVSENENPGALTGATGAELHSWLEWIDHNMQREAAARRLMNAVLDCPPVDRVPLMEFFIDALRGGAPLPAFGGIMAEARDWVAWASRAERKAYALASFEAMDAQDQAAFLRHVQPGRPQ